MVYISAKLLVKAGLASGKFSSWSSMVEDVATNRAYQIESQHFRGTASSIAQLM
jgi:hypothetical protein